MTRYVHIVIIAILYTFLFFKLSVAQKRNFIFESLSVEEGLSQSSVLSICQDSRGFLWIGTEDGLNKYDGYKFTVYKNIPNDSTSLGDNRVNAIIEDRIGNLWIGTREDLNRLDRKTGKFERVPILNLEGQPLTVGLVEDGIFEDSQQNIWIIAYPSVKSQKNIFRTIRKLSSGVLVLPVRSF